MSEFVIVKGRILRETDLAVLLIQDRNGERWESWIPRGECKRISKKPLPEHLMQWAAEIEMPSWLAEAKELEVEP